MATKGKKRAKMRADKARRKAERYKRGGAGDSTYAKKQRGEIVPNHSASQVWCGGCYRKVCACAERARERIKQLESELA